MSLMSVADIYIVSRTLLIYATPPCSYPIVLFILMLAEWSLENSNLKGFGSVIDYYDENWELLQEFINNIIYEGWNTKVTPEFEEFIN